MSSKNIYIIEQRKLMGSKYLCKNLIKYDESEILVQRDDADLLITTIDNVIVVQVDTNTILITN